MTAQAVTVSTEIREAVAHSSDSSTATEVCTVSRAAVVVSVVVVIFVVTVVMVVALALFYIESFYSNCAV